MEAAAFDAAKLENVDLRISQAVTATAAYWRTQGRFDQDLLRAEVGAERAKRKIVEDALPRWYEEPAWVVTWTLLGIGLVAGGTIAVEAVVFD